MIQPQTGEHLGVDLTVGEGSPDMVCSSKVDGKYVPWLLSILFFEPGSLTKLELISEAMLPGRGSQDLPISAVLWLQA